MKLGLFKIKKKLLPVTFKLELLENFRLYPVFHTALLEIAPVQMLLQTTLQTEGEQEYEV